MSVGCSPKSAKLVSASLKMTGSASSATVVQNDSKGFLSLLMGKAYALIPTSIQDSTGLSISLSSAWTVVDEIEFKSSETTSAEDSEMEVEFHGPYAVDLLSTAPLTLDTQNIAVKDIRRIKMKLQAASTLPAGAPAGLLNNSIYLAGTVGGNSFVVQMDDGTEMQIGGPTAFQPAQGSDLLVEIQLANIFKQINMSTVANGEVIDHTNRHTGANLCNSIDASATDIYTCIRKGLELRANFGVDQDNDDALDHSDSMVK